MAPLPNRTSKGQYHPPVCWLIAKFVQHPLVVVYRTSSLALAVNEHSCSLNWQCEHFSRRITAHTE